jgi:hypothetical protein
VETGWLRWCLGACHLVSGGASYSLVDTVLIVVVLGLCQFLLQLMSVPEKDAFQILPTKGADESESDGQVKLQQMIPGNGIHLRDILVAAPGSEVVIDSAGIPVTECRDDIVC